MTGERAFPWHVWGTGAVLAVFAAYCVWLFVAVVSLRGDLLDNVNELGELQRRQRAAVEAPLAPDLVVRVDERIRALRRDSRDLSDTLWRRWTALYVIVAAAVAIGIANLVLLVVAHRRRRRAETSEREVVAHHQTLRETATRLADGDLATAVVARGAGYDEFERALEEMRRSLVDQIGELSARNAEIVALADDLRAQIRERSSQLESRAADEARVGDSLAPGAVFADRYRIVKPIGAGGVGDVYEVVRVADRKLFALKLLRRVRSAHHRARFAREAKLLAELRHDHIVAIHHIGISPGGSMFLVMDLVRGKNLSQRRDRHGDVGFLVPVLERVAQALSSMHETGLVHRDVKPANIVVDDDPASTKLVDFGIAREIGADDAERGLGDQTGDTLIPYHTEIGTRMGTPMYMAPELARASHLADPSADVFALGVTAYRLLAVRAPFGTPPVDDPELLSVPTHLAELCPALNRDVADMVMRCLDVRPDARPSAAELALACLAEQTAGAG